MAEKTEAVLHALETLNMTVTSVNRTLKKILDELETQSTLLRHLSSQIR